MTLASIDINICDCGYFDLVQSPIPKWVERHWDTRSTPVAVTSCNFPVPGYYPNSKNKKSNIGIII